MLLARTPVIQKDATAVIPMREGYDEFGDLLSMLPQGARTKNAMGFFDMLFKPEPAVAKEKPKEKK